MSSLKYLSFLLEWDEMENFCCQEWFASNQKSRDLNKNIISFYYNLGEISETKMIEMKQDKGKSTFEQ